MCPRIDAADAHVKAAVAGGAFFVEIRIDAEVAVEDFFAEIAEAFLGALQERIEIGGVEGF